MHFIINQYLEFPGVAAVDDLPVSMDLLDWVDGKIINSPNEDLVLPLSEASGDYRGDIIEGACLLYSDKLKKAFDDFGVKNIQYFPVKIKGHNSDKIESGYNMVNIIGLIECVDRTQSEITSTASGVGENLGEFMVDESKTKGLKIFRLAERQTLVLISEDLVKYLNSIPIRGVAYTETNRFNGIR